MNITWRKGWVVFITLLCLVLLICAIAGEDWVHGNGNDTTMGLWQICDIDDGHTTCYNDLPFNGEWFKGVRALVTISTLLSALAFLFALSSILLDNENRFQKLSNPYIISGMLFVAGVFTIAASRHYLDKTPEFESGWTSAMGLASGIICLVGAVLLVVTTLFVRFPGEYESIAD